MLRSENRTIKGWADYALLDSGEGMKLERFGTVLLARPDTQALWQKSTPKLWKEANATFTLSSNKGKWQKREGAEEQWEISFAETKFRLRLGGFKHVGVFPEQADNWSFIEDRVAKLNSPKVLNLFGYTGVATLVAAKAGAEVTHVDASKQSLDIANANAALSYIPNDRIRWIPEDALAFARRELRRGIKYHGIILDPPAFGRGTKGQVWHVEQDLPKLLAVLKDLLVDAPGSFVVLNGYAAGYSATAFAELIKDHFPKLNGTYGELLIAEESGRQLPSGIFARGTL